MVINEDVLAILFIVLNSPVFVTFKPVFVSIMFHNKFTVSLFCIVDTFEIVWGCDTDVFIALFFRGSNFAKTSQWVAFSLTVDNRGNLGISIYTLP